MTKSALDDFVQAITGDERAQLRNIVRSVSQQLLIVVSLTDTQLSTEVKDTSRALASAALSYLDAKD